MRPPPTKLPRRALATGKLHAPSVRDLRGVMAREKAAIGGLITVEDRILAGPWPETLCRDGSKSSTHNGGTASTANPRAVRTASISRSGVNAEGDSSACCNNVSELMLIASCIRYGSESRGAGSPGYFESDVNLA